MFPRGFGERAEAKFCLPGWAEEMEETQRTSHRTWRGRVLGVEQGAVLTRATGRGSCGRAELELNLRVCMI